MEFIIHCLHGQIKEKNMAFGFKQGLGKTSSPTNFSYDKVEKLF